MKVMTECPLCRTASQIEVNENGYRAWKGGVHIQDALPELTASDREKLVSGICEKCWDNFMPENDE
ncbi:hypothetical protein [Fibrobacter sp. UWH4]|uniref:hypothetical protein n=1 Tax=Fibrobacter sp. UWH4 TaxID=1896210 RepID=UPI000911E464|nr:hypothetical protein [Fibrobacter sp. UWH4]SHL06323.1 hypothetical protein SAMN05720762_10490 [Fibrobacter sp. UWH4]